MHSLSDFCLISILADFVANMAQSNLNLNLEEIDVLVGIHRCDLQSNDYTNGCKKFGGFPTFQVREKNT